MYRKPSGKFGLHPLNIFADLPGSLSSSSGADPGHIASTQQDSVYLYQLQFSNPCAWRAETPYVAKIVDHEGVCRKIFQQLQKLGLIKADGEVDTTAFDSPSFGKQFIHSLTMIPASSQKYVVDLLFWWDEEARRLKKLLAERADLLAQQVGVEDATQRDMLELLMNRIQMKIGTRPSQRNAKIEQDEDLEEIEATVKGKATENVGSEHPPAYEERR